MGLRKRISRMITNLVDVESINRRIQQNQVEASLKQCVIKEGTKIYPEARIVNIKGDRDLISLGNNVHCRGQLLVFGFGGKIEVGNNVYIGDGTRIWSSSDEGVKIGNNVLISHNVFIGDTNSHEIDYVKRAESFLTIITKGHPKINPGVDAKPVVIEDHVWLSLNVIVMKGVTIGRGSIIGAGAIVTRDIPPFSLVVGAEARIVKSIELNTE